MQLNSKDLYTSALANAKQVKEELRRMGAAMLLTEYIEPLIERVVTARSLLVRDVALSYAQRVIEIHALKLLCMSPEDRAAALSEENIVPFLRMLSAEIAKDGRDRKLDSRLAECVRELESDASFRFPKV